MTNANKLCYVIIWKSMKKLKNSINWAIAAVVTVATVATTVSIANAYSITTDTASRQEINIINNSNCHFELAENKAIS